MDCQKGGGATCGQAGKLQASHRQAQGQRLRRRMAPRCAEPADWLWPERGQLCGIGPAGNQDLPRQMLWYCGQQTES